MIDVNIYRYNPETDKFPYTQTYTLKKPEKDIMLLELLNILKEQDSSISYRRSCREGVCGSDGMNINGKNGLACITPISQAIKNNKIELRPLPGLPVIRDLVVDMTEFYAQYDKFKMKLSPQLKNDYSLPLREISLMVYMSAFYVHVVQQAAHLFGGIQINLLDQLLCCRLIDLLLIQEIPKLQRG